MTAASKIVNEIVFPRMKETMVDLKVEFQNQFNAEKEKLIQKLEEEKEECKNTIREKLRLDFQEQFDEKERKLIEKLEKEKEEMVAEFDRETSLAKDAMKLELDQKVEEKHSALDDKVEEKQAELEQSLQDQVKVSTQKYSTFFFFLTTIISIVENE